MGEVERNRYGENILRKTLKGDGMRENCLRSQSFEQLKFGKYKKRKEPIKIPDLMTEIQASFDWY